MSTMRVLRSGLLVMGVGIGVANTIATARVSQAVMAPHGVQIAHVLQPGSRGIAVDV